MVVKAPIRLYQYLPRLKTSVADITRTRPDVPVHVTFPFAAYGDAGQERQVVRMPARQRMVREAGTSCRGSCEMFGACFVVRTFLGIYSE